MSLADALSKLTERLDSVLVLQSRFGGGDDRRFVRPDPRGYQRDNSVQHPDYRKYPNPPPQQYEDSPPSGAMGGSSSGASAASTPEAGPLRLTLAEIRANRAAEKPPSRPAAPAGSRLVGRLGGPKEEEPRPPPVPRGPQLYTSQELLERFRRDSRPFKITKEELIERGVPDDFENAFCFERYTGDEPIGRCIGRQLTIDDVVSYLRAMHYHVYGEVAMLGIAIKARNVIKNYGQSHGDMKKWRVFCNYMVHHHDGSVWDGAVPNAKTKIYNCRQLLCQFILPAMPESLVPVYSSEFDGAFDRHPAASDPIPSIGQVITIFRLLQKINPVLMEEIFLLGCAGVARNIVSCLMKINFRTVDDRDAFKQIETNFGNINTEEFKTISRGQNPVRDTVYNEPAGKLGKIYYNICSGIIHSEDSATALQKFFLDGNYDRHYDVLRYEVLNMVHAYMLRYPGRIPALAASAPTLFDHMVKGPAFFFSLFPELNTENSNKFKSIQSL
jgi:hypothetical protein